MKNILKINESIQNEVELNEQSDYKLGSYIYMAMAYKKDKKVCISIGYTLTYSIKKADEFLMLDSELVFSHVNKVLVGKKVADEKFHLQEPFKQYYE